MNPRTLVRVTGASFEYRRVTAAASAAAMADGDPIAAVLSPADPPVRSATGRSGFSVLERTVE
jgi:hypothetical protein